MSRKRILRYMQTLLSCSVQEVIIKIDMPHITNYSRTMEPRTRELRQGLIEIFVTRSRYHTNQILVKCQFRNK